MFGIDAAAWAAAVSAALAALKVAMLALLVTTLPELLNKMLEEFTEWLLKAFDMFKEVLFALFSVFFYKQFFILILCTLCSFLADILVDGIVKAFQILTVTEEILNLTAIKTPLRSVILLADAFVFLFVSMSVFKNFFAYFGFEAEEPIGIILKSAFSLIAIHSVESILQLALSINSIFVKLMWVLFLPAQATFDGAVPEALIREFKDAIYPAGISQILENPLNIATIQIDAILFFYVVYCFLGVLVKFAERYVLILLLVIISPLAFACSAVKITRGYFVSWLELFFGTLVMQVGQVGTMALIFVIPTLLGDSGSIVSDKIIYYVLILGCIEILDKTPEIINALGFTVGPEMPSSLIEEAGLTMIRWGATAMNYSRDFYGTLNSNYKNAAKKVDLNKKVGKAFNDTLNKTLDKKHMKQARKDLLKGISHLPGAPKDPNDRN